MSSLSEIQPVSAEIFKRLEACDTPTVCNVVELWDIHPRNRGYMDASIVACFPEMPSMVGYALTSTFRSMSPPRGGDVYSGIAQQVEAFSELPGPPVIVYQDLDIPVASATFGEVMCTTYKTFGAKGIITSGAGRDLREVQELGFPAFTNGTICAHGYCHTLAVNVPVTVGGLTIYPGDLLHGDRNGVTTIPHQIASEVPDACKELMAAERIILDYLKGQNLTAAAFAEARAECGAMIATLANRLKGTSN
jgi:4-hydroxy-4-methyl-2-oxoglutarate aldolase